MQVTLPEAAAIHAARVLRLQEGDAVTLFNGEGGEYAGNIAAIRKTGVSVSLNSYCPGERESPMDITLIQALVTGDKMDWVVQKAAELGVTRILPVMTRRSVLRLGGERAEKRVGHWQAVAIGACEQNGRNRVPSVGPISSLSDALDEHSGSIKFALQPDSAATLGSVRTPAQPLALLVGPEGGFSDEEIAAMHDAQCCFIRLGPRVMRTETAGIAALAAIQTLWGDLNR